ncbi:hypothetical protein Taro_052364, partial [Colocasia esculenta]|nr:hypothetical protein [Colocasia esculenta]
TRKRIARQPGQRNSQTHGQAHNALTRNAQADYNTDKRERESESSDNQNKHRAALGRTSTKSAKSRPGRTSPECSPTKRHTLNHRGNTTVAQNEHRALLGRTSARSDKREILGRTFTRMHNPNDQTTRTIRENTAASRTIEATQAGPGRTSTRPPRHRFGKTHQNTPAKRQHTSDPEAAPQQQKRARNSPERTLTRTTTN